MNVGVLGSGEVGTVLAEGFQAHGHRVMVGARTAAKLDDWAKKNPKIQIGTLAAAAQFGELVVLAVKGSAAPEALRAATAENLSGKLVIDATNPVTDAAPTNGVLSFFTSLDQSSMERLQREYGESEIQRRQTDDVHLRKRRGGQEDRQRRSGSIRLGNG